MLSRYAQGGSVVHFFPHRYYSHSTVHGMISVLSIITLSISLLSWFLALGQLSTQNVYLFNQKCLLSQLSELTSRTNQKLVQTQQQTQRQPRVSLPCLKYVSITSWFQQIDGRLLVFCSTCMHCFKRGDRQSMSSITSLLPPPIRYFAHLPRLAEL